MRLPISPRAHKSLLANLNSYKSFSFRLCPSLHAMLKLLGLLDSFTVCRFVDVKPAKHVEMPHLLLGQLQRVPLNFFVAHIGIRTVVSDLRQG